MSAEEVQNDGEAAQPPKTRKGSAKSAAFSKLRTRPCGVFAVSSEPCGDWGLVEAGVEASPDERGRLHSLQLQNQGAPRAHIQAVLKAPNVMAMHKTSIAQDVNRHQRIPEVGHGQLGGQQEPGRLR